MKILVALLLAGSLAYAQTDVGGRNFKGRLDATAAPSTAPIKSGLLSARPSACTRADVYFSTDATPGSNLSLCTTTGAPGTWTVVSSSGGTWGSITGTYTDQTDMVAAFAAASHTHAASDITSGVFDIARLATGTPTGNKFVRDDGVLATPSGSGNMALTSGSSDPSIACTAGTDYYFQTVSLDVWLCASSGTWKKILATANTGPFVNVGLAGTVPSTPASGYVTEYFDSTAKVPQAVDDAGAKSTMVRPLAAVTSNWIRSIGTNGTPTASQPAFSDISGSVAAAQLPNPSATTLGGIESFAAVTNQWIRSISTSGVPAASQPGFSDLSGTASTSQIAANAVTSAKMAVVNTRRTGCIAIGANNASAAISDTDLGPQSRQYLINSPQTLVEITVAADAGTPNIILGRSRAGTIVNLTSSALATAASGGIACSKGTAVTGLDGATTCSATLQNTALNAGDWITLVSGTAGGTAKEMTACFTTTVD